MHCRYAEGLEIRPGDELKTTCDFKNSKTGTFTYYGEDTSAEMCLAFVMYYPYINNFTHCIDYREKHLCDFARQRLEGGSVTIDGCNFTAMAGMLRNGGSMNPDATAILTSFLSVKQACTSDSCTSACKSAVSTMQENNPCFQSTNIHMLQLMMRYQNPDQNGQSGGLSDIVDKIKKCDEVSDIPDSAATIYHVSLLCLGVMLLSIFLFWIVALPFVKSHLQSILTVGSELIQLDIFQNLIYKALNNNRKILSEQAVVSSNFNLQFGTLLC